MKNFIKSLVFMSVTSSLLLSSIAWGASARPTVNTADTKEASATKRNIKKLNGLSQEQDIQAVNRCGYYTAFSIIKMMRAIGAAKKVESHPVDYYSKDWENLLNNREDFERFFEQNDKNKSSDNDNKEIDDKEMLDILHAAMGSGPCSNNVICIGDRQCDNSLKFSPAIADKLNTLDCKQPIGIAMNATQYFPHWIAGVINIKGDKVALFVVDPSDHGHDCCELKIVKAVYDFFLKKAQDMSRVAADDSKTAASSSSGSTSSSISSSSSLQAPAAANAATPAVAEKIDMLGKWRCPMCTFINKAQDVVCSTCHASPTKPGTDASTTPALAADEKKESKEERKLNKIDMSTSVSVSASTASSTTSSAEVAAKDDEKAVELYGQAANRIAPSLTFCKKNWFSLVIGEAEAHKRILQAVADRPNDIPTQNYLGGVLLRGEWGFAVDAERAVKLFESTAKKNDLEGLLYLGYCLHKGLGVEKDTKRAEALFKRAAGQYDANGEMVVKQWCCNLESELQEQQREREALGSLPQAEEKIEEQLSQFELDESQLTADQLNERGILFLNGNGVEKDPAHAVELFTKAAEKEHLGAKFNLGCCLQYGIGVEAKNEKKAVELYKQVAGKGYPEAMFMLAICKQKGIGCDRNEAEARTLFLQAGEDSLHYVPAQKHLGLMLLRGECGFKVDAERAVKLFKSASEKDDWDGLLFWGYCLHKGLGVKMDTKKAEELFRRAADQRGEAIVQKWYERLESVFHLKRDLESGLDALDLRDSGVCWEHGIGGVPKKDIKQAFTFYEQAAASGLPDAMLRLADCKQKGIGCDRNEEGARELFLRAAKDYPNYAPAQNRLGIIYLNGWYGFAKDAENAVRLFESTARKNDLWGLLYLGYCYKKGLGVKMDTQRADELFKLAADQYNATGEERVDAWYCTTKVERLFKHAANQGGASGEAKVLDWCNNLERDFDLKQAVQYAQQAQQDALALLAQERKQFEQRTLDLQREKEVLQQQICALTTSNRDLQQKGWSLERLQEDFKRAEADRRKQVAASTEMIEQLLMAQEVLKKELNAQRKLELDAQRKLELDAQRKLELDAQLKLQVEGEKPEVEGAGPEGDVKQEAEEGAGSEGAERKVQNDAEQKDALVCTICRDRSINRCLPCGHLICDQCMNGLPISPSETNPRCPQCRVLFDPARAQRVYP